MMHKASRLVLFAALVISLVAGASVGVSAKQFEVFGIGDCRVMTIDKATKKFRRLDGSRSKRWEWRRNKGRGVLVHKAGPKVRGVVLDNHFAVGNDVKWHLEGKLVVKKRFDIWCVPPSGTYNTNKPPAYCPATPDDAIHVWGGNPEHWTGSINKYSSQLQYWAAAGEKLGSFTVPFQAYVMGMSWSDTKARYYTPGDTVRPHEVVEITCWR